MDNSEHISSSEHIVNPTHMANPVHMANSEHIPASSYITTSDPISNMVQQLCPVIHRTSTAVNIPGPKEYAISIHLASTVTDDTKSMHTIGETSLSFICYDKIITYLPTGEAGVTYKPIHSKNMRIKLESIILNAYEKPDNFSFINGFESIIINGIHIINYRNSDNTIPKRKKERKRDMKSTSGYEGNIHSTDVSQNIELHAEKALTKKFNDLKTYLEVNIANGKIVITPPKNVPDVIQHNKTGSTNSEILDTKQDATDSANSEVTDVAKQDATDSANSEVTYVTKQDATDSANNDVTYVTQRDTTDSANNDVTDVKQEVQEIINIMTKFFLEKLDTSQFQKEFKKISAMFDLVKTYVIYPSNESKKIEPFLDSSGGHNAEFLDPSTSSIGLDDCYSEEQSMSEKTQFYAEFCSYMEKSAKKFFQKKLEQKTAMLLDPETNTTPLHENFSASEEE